MRISRVSLWTIGFVFALTSAHAAELTWDGGGTSNIWGNVTNWTGDSVAPSNGDGVVFASAGSWLTNNNNLAANTLLQGVQLRGDNWHITGNSLTLTQTVSGGITISNGTATATATNVWLLNLTFGQAQTWTNVQGTLFVGGTVNNNSKAWTLAGADNYGFTNALSGSGALTINGTGTTTFSGTAANTASGGYVNNAGTLRLNKSAGVDAVSDAITVNNGALPVARRRAGRQRRDDHDQRRWRVRREWPHGDAGPRGRQWWREPWRGHAGVERAGREQLCWRDHQRRHADRDQQCR